MQLTVYLRNAVATLLCLFFAKLKKTVAVRFNATALQQLI